MSKQKPKKTISAQKHPDSTAELRKVLSSQKKEELVNVILQLAKADRRLLRQLTAQFDVAPAPDELVAATSQAISDATDFDEREMNRNFDYDSEAYEDVKRNLKRLIHSGHIRPALKLSLELMKQGSYPVEMSDEGLMTHEIEDCLSVILKSVETCELPPKELIEWCTAMLESDRTRFIADQELESLRKRLQIVSRQ